MNGLLVFHQARQMQQFAITLFRTRLKIIFQLDMSFSCNEYYSAHALFVVVLFILLNAFNIIGT
jgi:hypothetical protein